MSWLRLCLHLHHPLFCQHLRRLFEQGGRADGLIQTVQLRRDNPRAQAVVYRQIGRLFKVGLCRHFAFLRQQVQHGRPLDFLLRRQCFGQSLRQFHAVGKHRFAVFIQNQSRRNIGVHAAFFRGHAAFLQHLRPVGGQAGQAVFVQPHGRQRKGIGDIFARLSLFARHIVAAVPVPPRQAV